MTDIFRFANGKISAVAKGGSLPRLGGVAAPIEDNDIATKAWVKKEVLTGDFVPISGTESGIPVTGIIESSSSLKIDTIDEYTGNAGVTIDSVKLKDKSVIVPENDGSIQLNADDTDTFLSYNSTGVNLELANNKTSGNLLLRGKVTAGLYIGADSLAILEATSSGIAIKDNKNMIFGITNGNQIGTATNQKISFWGKTPVIQQAHADQGTLSLDIDVTGGDTVDKAAINTNFTNLQTLVNRLRTDLVTTGMIKGAA